MARVLKCCEKEAGPCVLMHLRCKAELDSQDLAAMAMLPRQGVQDAGELIYAVCRLGVVTRVLSSGIIVAGEVAAAATALEES